MAEQEQVMVRSKDGEEVSMRRGVAERILMLKDMLEEDLATSTINVDVDAVVMRHVVSFYDWLVDHAEATEQDRKGHAQQFLGGLKTSAMLETMVAANYLNAKELLDATVVFFGKLIANKDPDGIREALGIKTPFLPGEIEEAAAKNKWTFKLDQASGGAAPSSS